MAQLTQLIVDSVRELPNAKNNTDAARAKAVYTENAKRLTKEADNVQARLTDEMQRRAMECARVKGGSAVLTTMPIAEYGFNFAAKADF